MPELAEVAYYANRWKEGLSDRIERVAAHLQARCFRGLLDRSDLRKGLEGKRLVSSHTHGKQMLWEIEGGSWLYLHLGMTGKLRGEPADFTPGKHDHLVLFQRERALVFSDTRTFGQVRLLAESSGFPSFWESLPPEILSKHFTKKRLQTFLRRRSRTPLKPLLLDQSMFPGIGNWMADEVLWRCGFHPTLPAGRLDSDSVALLWRELRHVCRFALRWIAQDWTDPPKTWLIRHRWKDGGICPCGTPLVRESIGGRTTCWCPACQGRAARPVPD